MQRIGESQKARFIRGWIVTKTAAKAHMKYIAFNFFDDTETWTLGSAGAHGQHPFGFGIVRNPILRAGVGEIDSNSSLLRRREPEFLQPAWRMQSAPAGIHYQIRRDRVRAAIIMVNDPANALVSANQLPYSAIASKTYIG